MARQMKDSGIEWIDSIPSHWQTIKLCYVTEAIFLGKTPVYFEGENENYTLGQRNNQQYGLDFTGIKYSTDEHFASCNEQEFLQYGDVLLNSLGTGSVGRIGYFGITDKRVLTDGHIIVIRANEQMNARFLFFYLRTLRTKFEDDAVGSTNQAFLTVPKIYKTLVPFPPLDEQQRIVAFLDRKCAEIDAVIERTKATIEEYKKLKQAVITEAVTKGVRGPRPLKDSGIEWIGEIPEGWVLKRLKATFLERKEKNDPIQTDFILSLGAAYGVIPYSEKEGGGNKAKEELTDYRLAYPNDIVMNSMNIISGSVGLSKYFGCVSPVYYMLYPRNNDVDQRFFCYLFQTKAFQRSLLGLGNGILVKESGNGNFNTVRMRIPMEKLGVQRLPTPCLSEQKEIADYLDEKCAALDILIVKKTALLTELETYKKSLIYEYVTGKKEVTA